MKERKTIVLVYRSIEWDAGEFQHVHVTHAWDKEDARNAFTRATECDPMFVIVWEGTEQEFRGEHAGDDVPPCAGTLNARTDEHDSPLALLFLALSGDTFDDASSLN